MPERRPAAAPTSDGALGPRQPRAISHALTVLEAVAALGPGTTAREISASLGMPRASAYRLLNLLVQDEFLVRTPDLMGFALGAKVVQLAAVAAPLRLTTAAREVITEARFRVRGGLHVALYPQGRIALVDSDPDFPFSDSMRLAREPWRFAIGRLLLVEAPGDDPSLQAASADLARWGATRQMNELTPGHGCLALPIRDAAGALAGALGFSGSVHRVEEPRKIIELLRPTAERLSPLLT